MRDVQGRNTAFQWYFQQNSSDLGGLPKIKLFAIALRCWPALDAARSISGDVMTDRNYLKAELTELIQSDERTWTFLQQGSLDGVWYWDLEKPDNEWMSPEFWKLFGIDPTNKSHNPAEWQDIIFEDDLAAALENFNAHCADANHPYDQIVRYRHADGSVVWVRCRGLAIRDAAGTPIRMLGAHTDLTAVKQSEENAREASQAAELANSDLKSFAYSVSHDLKAPTNTLKLLLEELDFATQGQLSDDARELMGMAQLTVARMRTQIDDVLEYTHLIGEDPRLVTVDLATIAANVVAALHGDVKTTGAQITVGALPQVQGISTQLHILFQNMISNALKFQPKGRTPKVDIACKLHRKTNCHRISFADNGIGISKNDQKKIFGLFQRLHTKDSIAGTGIGLSLCQRVAVNHGGGLRVESTLGAGATFILTLPAIAHGDE
jgi:PAS domain S-box-containing protein